jgi:signal transduction histidine kinase
VVVSLLSNAVKYGAGSPIQVEAGPSPGGVRLVVADEGSGIAPEDHERIFQPFIRLRDSQPGVGLGLWLARKIAQAHGGTIEVSSRPPGGTRVTVVLPSAR